MPRTTHRMAPLAVVLALVAGGAAASTGAGLEDVLDQRLAGDRSGACIAAALIQGDRVQRAHRCADPALQARIAGRAAFEIGSVTKTMTATLLAAMIGRGEASLDDPLADWLPTGTVVPDYEGQPILLRHVVTHTSGLPALPARMPVVDPGDPYARLDETALLASLADVRLAEPPGTRFAYSNFASMLLSWALAERAGVDFETLLERELLTPLGMDDAFITSAPDGVRVVEGHLPSARPTAAWTFPVDMAGVGGVRATLDDMVRYARAQLGQAEGPLADAIERTQAEVDGGIAMNWMLTRAGDRIVHAHEGGTGGFSSLVAFDRARGQAVVLLSDTALHSTGGLGQLGLFLLGIGDSPGAPRREVAAPPELVDALVGEYRLEGAGTVALSRRGDALAVQAPGQGEFRFGHDDAGDFFLREVDAVLRPRRGEDGSYSFVWLQGGGAVPAVRVDASAGAPAHPMPDADTLRAYAGTYPLAPGFELVVRERDGGLYAQATGQGEFALSATAAADVFAAPAFGIRIDFRRDGGGAVSGLELHQGGRVMPASRR